RTGPRPVAEEGCPWEIPSDVLDWGVVVEAIVLWKKKPFGDAVLLTSEGDTGSSSSSEGSCPLPDSSSPLPEISSSMGTFPLKASLLCFTAKKFAGLESEKMYNMQFDVLTIIL